MPGDEYTTVASMKHVSCRPFRCVVLTATAATTATTIATAASMGEMHELSPTLETYNAAIRACAKEAQWGAALSLLDEMRRENSSRPDADPDSCGESGGGGGGGGRQQRHEVADVYATSASAVKPDQISYNAAISACGRAGRPIEALELLNQMREVSS